MEGFQKGWRRGKVRMDVARGWGKGERHTVGDLSKRHSGVIFMIRLP